MTIDLFHRSIMNCSSILEPYGVNVYDLIMNGDDAQFTNTLNCFVSICAIQVSVTFFVWVHFDIANAPIFKIALTDCLKHMGIEPDGIAGHSTGEMVAGYCDGCTTAEETMLCAYYRGKSIMESNLPSGKFLALYMLKLNKCETVCEQAFYTITGLITE